MIVTPRTGACPSCGSSATYRDSREYMYCRDCASVSAIGRTTFDTPYGVDRWAWEGGESLHHTTVEA
jgi:hypothetical protein